MMRSCIFVFLMLGWIYPAQAQQTIESLCQNLGAYVPVEDARYTPDSEVPADLNAIHNPIFGSISIPVEIDLAEFFDRDDLRGVPGLLLRPEISNIEVNQDGSVYYNGQEITEDIQRVCGSSVTIVNDVIVEPPPPPTPMTMMGEPETLGI